MYDICLVNKTGQNNSTPMLTHWWIMSAQSTKCIPMEMRSLVIESGSLLQIYRHSYMMKSDTPEPSRQPSPLQGTYLYCVAVGRGEFVYIDYTTSHCLMYIHSTYNAIPLRDIGLGRGESHSYTNIH